MQAQRIKHTHTDRGDRHDPYAPCITTNPEHGKISVFLCVVLHPVRLSASNAALCVCVCVQWSAGTREGGRGRRVRFCLFYINFLLYAITVAHCNILACFTTYPSAHRSNMRSTRAQNEKRFAIRRGRMCNGEILRLCTRTTKG